MTVELICVGTELLLGNIVNTNAAYLSERCARLGLSMYYQSVVGDNPGRLLGLLRTAVSRSDIVILSGGLGPTQDDLTKETAAEVMGLPLVEDKEARRRIEEFFKTYHERPTENNWKQALVPKGSIVLQNENGTAPGIIIEGKNSTVILLPGPPNELIPMFEKQAASYLDHLQPKIIRSRMVKICGMGESQVETKILDLIEKQTNPTIATYAKTGEVHIRLTAMADSEQGAKELLLPVEKELYQRFGKLIYTDREEVTLEDTIAALLKEQNLHVATAESCTGGLIAGRLINVSGISDSFNEGYITYSNEAKEHLLGVSHETLETYGAVSSQTAAEMAEGARRAAGAEVSVISTGIAGPGGGTKEKPVGLVYLASSWFGKVTVEKYIFNGNRAKVREAAVTRALALLRKTILNSEKE